MLSRFTRIAAMSSQIGGGLSLLRDDRTVPKVTLGALGADHHFYNDHAPYCKTLPRVRTASFGNDPFMGMPDPGSSDLGILDPSPDVFIGSLSDSFSWIERFGPITFEDPGLDMRDSLEAHGSIDPGSGNDDGKNTSDWMKSYVADPFADVSSPVSEFRIMELEKSSSDLQCEFKKEVPDWFDFSEMKREIKEEVDDDFCDFRSVSEVSDSYRSFSSYSQVKKRGVKLKPKSDDMTNRRRLMNREAALRYRERRRDKNVRFRMHYLQLERRNRELKILETKMLKEVAYYERLIQLKQV